MATSALLWAFFMSQYSLVSDGGGLTISVHIKSMCHGKKKLKYIVNNIQCQQWLVKEQYTEQWKNPEWQIWCWTKEITNNAVFLRWSMVYKM
jgi:hypothetical protein